MSSGCGERPLELDVGRMREPAPEVQSLLKAARRGDLEGIGAAVEANVDLDARDPVNLGTALLRATKFGELGTVEALLRSGASPDLGDRHDVTPLHEAARSGQADILAVLLAAGASVDSAELIQGHTPLHLAAMAGQSEATKLLLRAGADPNFRLRFGEPSPALEAAISQSYLEVARALIEGGADVEQKDAFGRSPLHQSLQLAQDEDPEIVRLLLDAGADIDSQDDEGRTVLEAARDYLALERAGSRYHDRRRRTLEALEARR